MDSVKAPTLTKSASLVYEFIGILFGFWCPEGLSKLSLLTMWSFQSVARRTYKKTEYKRMVLIKKILLWNSLTTVQYRMMKFTWHILSGWCSKGWEKRGSSVSAKCKVRAGRSARRGTVHPP